MELPLALIILVVGFFAWSWWRYYTSDHGAPFVTMSQDLVDRVLEMAHVGKDDVVYDLGSGDGRIPIMAALKYDATAVGVEIDPLRVIYSKAHAFILGLRNKVTFLKENLFNVDLSSATVIVVYLNHDTNEVLEEKLDKELKQGTRVVSAGFVFPGWKPVQIDEKHSTPWGPLYLYEK